MGWDTDILEIPIYRLSDDAWDRETEVRVDQCVDGLLADTTQPGELVEDDRDHVDRPSFRDLWRL